NVDIIIEVSQDNKQYTTLIDTELEHRAGDHLYDLPQPIVAQFLKLTITENYGGSGIFVHKVFAFGEEANK
ncbi:MAG: hypothetical protein EZS28_050959, partial [Streblomastix strix]